MNQKEGMETCCLCDKESIRIKYCAENVVIDYMSILKRLKFKVTGSE
jgi:hypothetical protein